MNRLDRRQQVSFGYRIQRSHLLGMTMMKGLVDDMAGQSNCPPKSATLPVEGWANT